VSTVSIDLEQALEADDGVVEVLRVRPHLEVPWAVLAPGPRRWAPTDLSVELDGSGDRLQLVRMTYRTVGDRSVVVAGIRPDADVDEVVAKLAKPLMYSYLRRLHTDAPVTQIVAALDCSPRWEVVGAEGWRTGTAGTGDRPVRVAHVAHVDGHVVVAAHGVAEEELTTIVAGLQPVTAEDEDRLADLHTRHRQALAQRWWDAPRVPWTPAD
jgi:hypothetical protein